MKVKVAINSFRGRPRRVRRVHAVPMFAKPATATTDFACMLGSVHAGVLACVTASALLLPCAASADVFWDKPSVLKAFFATSQLVTYKVIQPTPAQAAALQQRTGRAPGAAVTVYYGVTRDHVDGVAVIDDELGQHEPITFAALVGPDGTLRRVEVMVYREAYGDAVREARFRRQFVGKTTADPVRHGQDIVAVAGATISSRSLATGARRALHLVDELVLKPGIARSLGVAPKVAAGDSPPTVDSTKTGTVASTKTGNVAAADTGNRATATP